MTSLYDVFTATDKVKQIKLDYVKDCSLKSQILFIYGNVHLMSVSKTYCNDIYLGVNFLFMVNKELLKVNRDVNRGYSERLVDNFDELVKFPHFIHTCKTYDNAFLNKQKISTESFSFTHQNEKVRCEKIYIDDEYCFSNFHTRNIVSRGAYSGKGFTQGTRFDKVKYTAENNNLIKEYYKEKSYVSLSNTYSYVNTEYSTIKPTY
tara:strand:- start:22 stop:639 length:618 start_codon:yes stop_codon:yes gene_type:complete